MNEAIIAGTILGVAGSMHCVGMCGPLILLFPSVNKNRNSAILNTVVYHTGRVTSYVSLGLLFGLVFKLVDIKLFAHWFSISIGLAFLLLWGRELWLKKSSGQGFIYLTLLKMFNSAIQWSNGLGMFFAGVANGLLPCGLVYGALLAAFGMGNSSGTALFMLFFGLATMPSLVILGLLKQRISNAIRFKLSKLLPWWLLIFGVWFLLRGANLGIPYLSPKISGQNSGQQSCCKPIK